MYTALYSVLHMFGAFTFLNVGQDRVVHAPTQGYDLLEEGLCKKLALLGQKSELFY